MKNLSDCLQFNYNIRFHKLIIYANYITYYWED